MGRAHGIALLGLVMVGTAVWLGLGTGDRAGAPAPSGSAAPVDPPATPPTSATGLRTEVDAVAPSRPTIADPAGTAQQAAPDTAEPSPNLYVAVYSLPGRLPVPAFRWTLEVDGARTHGVSTAAREGLRVLCDQAYHLLVEAEGMEPQRRNGTVRSGAPPAELEIELTPTALGAGVELHATDDAGRPVEALRVDLWRLDEDTLADTAVGGPPLWSRRTTDPRGRYQLPELQPGRYELRAMAIDEAGEPRPLLPHRVRFGFSGTDRPVLFAQLVPGAILVLEPVDPRGEPMPAAQEGAASPGLEIRAIGPDGRRDIGWGTMGTGPRTVMQNGFPTTTAACATEALRPGSWRFEVWCRGTLRGTRDVLLLSGQQHRERIAVAAPR